MPFPGKEEPGVLTPQQLQSSCIPIKKREFAASWPSSQIIPIKKRKFPVFFPSSPLKDEELPSDSNVDDSEKKQELKNLEQQPPFGDDIDTDSPDVENNFTSMVEEEKAANPSAVQEQPLGSEFDDSKNNQESKNPDQEPYSDAAVGSPVKSDVGKNSIIMTEEEKVTDAKVGLEQISGFKTPEAKLDLSSGSIDDSGNRANCLWSEQSAAPEVSGSRVDAPVATMGNEIVGIHVEGDFNLNLSMGARDVESEAHKNIEEEHKMPDKLDPSLLSLSLSKEKPITHEGSDRVSDNVSIGICSNNRSKWDLNTTMDSWEGSAPSEAFLHNNVVTGEFKGNDMHDVKCSSTLAGTIGFSGNRVKPNLDEHRSSFSNTSTQPDQQYKHADSLGFDLAMPCGSLNSSSEHSLPSVIRSTMNLQSATCGTVKLEPINENMDTGRTVDPCTSVELPKLDSVKGEVVESHSSGIVLPSSNSPEKLVGQISMKSDAFQEDGKSASAMVSDSVDKVMQHQEGSASTSNLSNTATPQNSCTTLTTFLDSTMKLVKVMQHQDSSASTSVLSNPMTTQNSCPSIVPTSVDSTMNQELSNQSEHSICDQESCLPDEPIDTVIPEPVGDKTKQSSDQCDMIDNRKDEDSEKCKAVRLDEHPLEYCSNEELSGGDEEKVDISKDMLGRISFRSDHASGRNYAFTSDMDMDEDVEYEDGEIQDPLARSIVEDLIVEGKDSRTVNIVDCNIGKTDIPELNGIGADIGIHDETNTEQIKECVDMGSNEFDNVDASLPKSIPSQEREDRVDEKKHISFTPEKPIYSPGNEDVAEGNENKVSADSTTTASSGTGAMLGLGEEGSDAYVIKSSAQKHSITSSKVDAAVNGSSDAKDSSNVGNKSRIINLSRASSATSPSKTRYIPERLSSRSGKEVSSDFEGDTLHRRNSSFSRERSLTDGPDRYTRGRIQDQSFRNSRSSVIVSGRFGNDFTSDSYNGPHEYWVARHKRSSSISDAELECSGYDTGRRKSLNDESPSFRHPSFRRRFSPGCRDVSRRIPRNISPSRRSDEDDVQDFSDDTVGPVFSRSQRSYENTDGRVSRGNRNFYQNRSKSLNQTQSPGSWSDPRRRSPGSWSPAMRGMGRMRSPDAACFPDKIPPRRRGSPSYVRGGDSRRGHIRPRFFNSNRGSHLQEFPGRSRRDADEYFTPPEYSSRIQGPRGRGGGSSDDERKLRERQGPPRSFRPNYSDDGDNFRYRRVNDGQRMFSFCPEGERDFDGDAKHRPRMRNIKEDGNYRTGDRPWNDDEFDDASRERRRRRFDLRKEY